MTLPESVSCNFVTNQYAPALGKSDWFGNNGGEARAHAPV